MRTRSKINSDGSVTERSNLSDLNKYPDGTKKVKAPSTETRGDKTATAMPAKRKAMTNEEEIRSTRGTQMERGSYYDNKDKNQFEGDVYQAQDKARDIKKAQQNQRDKALERAVSGKFEKGTSGVSNSKKSLAERYAENKGGYARALQSGKVVEKNGKKVVTDPDTGLEYEYKGNPEKTSESTKQGLSKINNQIDGDNSAKRRMPKAMNLMPQSDKVNIPMSNPKSGNLGTPKTSSMYDNEAVRKATGRTGQISNRDRINAAKGNNTSSTSTPVTAFSKREEEFQRKLRNK
jgi:hypothetical protein